MRTLPDSGIAVRTLFYTEQAAQEYASYLERVVPRAAACVSAGSRMWRNCWRRPRRRRGFSVSVKSARGTVGLEVLSPRGARSLAVGNLQDPGNLGAVLRTAEALGLSGVLLAGNCCDAV